MRSVLAWTAAPPSRSPVPCGISATSGRLPCSLHSCSPRLRPTTSLTTFYSCLKVHQVACCNFLALHDDEFLRFMFGIKLLLVIRGGSSYDAKSHRHSFSLHLFLVALLQPTPEKQYLLNDIRLICEGLSKACCVIEVHA